MSSNTYLPSCESLQIEKEKKEERKKEKKTDRTQTKLDAPHVRYNAKILRQ